MLTNDAKIIKCIARQILDSRGSATIEVEITAKLNGEEISAKAAVPSGKSTGSEEAYEMRDADGGVLQVIESVEKKIAPEILNQPLDSEQIDHLMLTLDTTRNKKNIGANAMLGVSMAVIRLEAKVRKMPLWKIISEKSRFPVGKPKLYMNTLNGGAHADFCLPFQEYILAVSGETLAGANEKAQAVFQKVKNKLDEKNISYYTGDEGGLAPRLETLDEPFQILTDCIGDDPDIFIAIDAAASEFYDEKSGTYEILGNKYDRANLILIYDELVKKFNLRSIEDPIDEKDFPGFLQIVKFLGESALVIGDDLTVTNPLLVKKYGERKCATGIIIKPNQIGTILETFEAIREARSFGWKIVVSHRSGETMDSFIADLAVGVGAFAIKAGAHTQPERKAKYDRLVEIEKEMIQDEIAEKIKKEEADKARWREINS